ncbi:MAG: tRNA uridine-5-carboxymethylaminomethyl(34) synthesis enzyme MnmG [Bacillales bacterium]|nr:tRNA uridine-5-carboxymethylaminomethyl(34) synthesis enzyme MnmG [Bacillales bacterium]
MDYDIIVVGGGHAGMEAAFASAHMGLSTLLITLNKKMMANMPCNPSIGGSAKGIVVREIDALGGMMGKAADKGQLQMKMLNTGKGPGVQCLRAQEDKLDYPKAMQEFAQNCKNLTILEGMVTSLLHNDHEVFGVRINEKEITSKAVILTTGTYMESKIIRGHTAFTGGPDGEEPSLGLSPYLKDMGISIIRLKTGTPQRIKASSIDYSVLEPQYGTKGNLAFSYETKEYVPLDKQIVCYLTYTNEKTHQIIRDHLQDSGRFGGIENEEGELNPLEGVGPRYCPSIEDKIVRFADKPRHQLFIEPESIHTDLIYLQGFSTSMPEEVQEEMVHSLKGLEHAEIVKYAYAIEYDAIASFEYDYTLELKKYSGLYIGGQICGTSGYEEAAALGLIAGINASLKILGKEPLILRRDQAYIGVMIDDLVSKGTKEPYRLLSSRAEYRLLMRHDNADLRLRDIGHEIGLVSDEVYNDFLKKKENLQIAKQIMDTTFMGMKEDFVTYMHNLGYEKYQGGPSASSILKRPNVKLCDLKKFVDGLPILDETSEMQLEVMIKYEGYIEKEKKDAERLAKLEKVKIPEGISYASLDGLRLEARQKLDLVHPHTIGQASRISGVNPTDIEMLLLHIKKGI